MFGRKCKRQHAIDEHGSRMLEERGLSVDIINNLPLIYKNIHHLTVAAGENKASDMLQNTPACAPLVHFFFLRGRRVESTFVCLQSYRSVNVKELSHTYEKPSHNYNKTIS